MNEAQRRGIDQFRRKCRGLMQAYRVQSEVTNYKEM